MKYIVEIDNSNKILGWYLKEDDFIESNKFINISKDIFETQMNNGANYYENGQFLIKDIRTPTEILKELKATKTNEVNKSVKAFIIAGFDSSALGPSHKYQSDETDQLNLIGVVSGGIGQKFKCSADGGKTWEWKFHSAEQLKEVLKDGADTKTQLLENATVLKNSIATAVTIEEVMAIEI